MPTAKKNKSVRTVRRARLDKGGTAEPLTKLVAKVPVGETFMGRATHYEGEDGTRVPLTTSVADTMGYEPFLRRIRDCLDYLPAGTPIFNTEDTRQLPLDGDAMRVFLGMIPAGEFRQHYNCRACASFLNRYAGLVTIGAQGELKPVIWHSHFPESGTLDVFRSVWSRFHAETTAGYRRVTGVFLSSEIAWGDTRATRNPKLGFIQNHMSLTPPKSLVYSHPLKTAEQAMAEKKEEYRMLQRGLARFDRGAVDKAVAWLRSWKISRDRVEHSHMAEWLLSLILSLTNQPQMRRNNLVWLAVATAPVGYCHFSSGVLGTLLEKILLGWGPTDCRREYNLMLDPLKYQRPQAAPSAGNVKAAEKLVGLMGIERSLERRFARLEELTAVWTPRVAPPPKPAPSALAGTFGTWARQIQEAVSGVRVEARLPAAVMTWEKFQREVLPHAIKITCYVPAGRANFVAFVTAKHLDAPPILRWDSREHRNPVSYYVYHKGSLASAWGLHTKLGYYVDVKAVVDHPATWGKGPLALRGKETFFILPGCHDVNAQGGLGLFPEILNPELHGVRATIESYSQNHRLQADPSSAAGLHVVGAELEVFTPHSRQKIKIDRWD